MPSTIKLIRLPAACAMTGYQPTTYYGHVKKGLITPAIKITDRCSAWPEHELSAINAARMAGKSDNEIRQLVQQLVAQRASATATAA